MPLSILEVSDEQCKFPVTDTSPHLFCGKPVEQAPYCNKCRAIAYEPTRYPYSVEGLARYIHHASGVKEHHKSRSVKDEANPPNTQPIDSILAGKRAAGEISIPKPLEDEDA